MRLGIWLVIALFAGTLLTHWLLQDRGYVLINFRGYAIEMSLPVLVLLLVLLYAAARLIIRLFRVPRRLGEAAGRQRAKRSHQRFVRGLIELEEGNFARGERLLTQGVSRSDMPLANYLLAARAAQRQGESERRDDWLRRAYEETPEASNAVLLAQAELQMAHGQFEQALATLRSLEKKAPNHAHALTLLARLYARLGEWESLKQLLPRLRRRKAMTETEITTLAMRTHTALIREAGESDDAAALDRVWQEVPKADRMRPDLVEVYARGLMRQQRHDDAERIVRKRLKRDWQEMLVLLYGQIVASDASKQLRQAESWLQDRGEDAALLLTVGRLSVRNELWGKARSYLETSLAIQPRAEGYRLYGQLLERLGESDAASEAFRLGLGLVTEPAEIPALPRQVKRESP